jgi:DNA-binding GntR family transcriptional regulator
MLKSNSIPQKVQLGHQVYQILRDKIYRTEIEPGAYLGVGEIPASFQKGHFARKIGLQFRVQIG